MSSTKFVYVTYISTTPEKLWQALLKPEFTRKYWAGITMESDWAAGSSWKMLTPDGRIADAGVILEVDAPNRLVISWRHELMEEFRGVGATTATFEISQAGDNVKLVVTHEVPIGGENLLEAFASGWPHILSSLKTLLETGEALPGSDRWPEGV